MGEATFEMTAEEDSFGESRPISRGINRAITPRPSSGGTLAAVRRAAAEDKDVHDEDKDRAHATKHDRLRIERPSSSGRPSTPAAEGGHHYMTNIQAALIFNPFRDQGQAKPYTEEGDPEMSSEANELRRADLSTHPAIQDALFRLIALYELDEEGRIPKAEYITKHRRVAMLLMPQMPAEETLAEAVVDWGDDADGEDSISQEALTNALFQLTDIWCKTTQVGEYLAFLDTLAQRL